MEDKIREIILEHSCLIGSEINSDGESVYTDDDRRIDTIDINSMVKKIMLIIEGSKK